MVLLTTIICLFPVFVAAYVLGEKRGHDKGYKEGFIDGSKKGIRNTTKCLERTLKAAGYKDTWISGLFTKMSDNIKPVE